jgi:hypothetical protein
MTTKPTTEKEGRRYNTGLAKVAVQCSADTFVVNQSLVLRINIYGERRPPSPNAGTFAVIIENPYNK